MDKIIEELKTLTNEVADAKTNVAILESKAEDSVKKLLSEFKLKSVEAGETLLEKKTKELADLEATIKEKFAILKETYQWG